MSNSHSVLSQLLQWIPRHEFQIGVDKHNSDKGVRRLSSWSQFVALLFGQLIGHRYEFVTNRFNLSAKTICDLYKARWEVELFFKTLKGKLQVKKYVGTSANAVKAQIWVALIAYLLMMMVKFRSKLGWGTPAIMAVLTVTLFANRELRSIWEYAPKEIRIKPISSQLSLFPI